MNKILAFLGREPVLLGAALSAWLLVPAWSDLVHVAVTATIAWFVRILSVPASKVQAQVDTAVQAKSDEIHAYLTGATAPIEPPQPD